MKNLYYLDKFSLGATLLPRCYWFVQPAPGSPIDHTAPFLETNIEVYRQAKGKWRLARHGRIESQYLYETVIPKNLVPFGVIKPNLVFVPLHQEGQSSVLNAAQLLRANKLYAAQWMKAVEQTWRSNNAHPCESLHDKLNENSTLTSQNPLGKMVVLYNTSGLNLTASLHFPEKEEQTLKGNGFIANHETHYHYPESEQEGDYLCAVLNSTVINKTIKTHRHEQLADKTAIHLLPFKLQSIPRFDPHNLEHSLLAKTSRECRLAVRDKIERSRRTAKNIHVAIAQITKKHLRMIDEKVWLLGKST